MRSFLTLDNITKNIKYQKFDIFIMSNPEINKQDQSLNTTQNDLRIKRNICLFNFSNLRSSSRLSLSEFNDFKYDLSIKQQNKFGTIQNNNCLGRYENAYIKNITLNIPSAEKLSNNEFKNDFIKDFDESYAHFCGLNEKQYIDAYINNAYIPKLNEIGDLNISINSIFEILKTYSDSKYVKISRKLLKANRIKRRAKLKFSKKLINKSKKIFQVLPNNNEKEIKEIVLKNEDDDFNELNKKGSLENDNKNKNGLINNFENTPSLMSIECENQNQENQNAQKSKTLLNIKKKLKNISIPGTNNSALKYRNHLNDLSNLSLEKNNKLNSKNLIINNNKILINEINNSNDNKNLAYNTSQTIPLNSCQNGNSSNLLSHKHLRNSNDNIFSFSSSILQNYDSNSQNKNKNEIFNKHLNTPFNNNSINNNLNLNSPPIIRPVLNTGIFSPNLDNNILSPNSYNFDKSNISSPMLLNISPSNNNFFFNDAFTFNNVNISSFVFGHNKSENSINICENNNINTINGKPNDSGEIMHIHGQEGKDNEKK